MNHISLFSGIGGFDYAAEQMGWQNIAHCEINPFCLQILKYYWPNAQTHTDIKTTDFSIYRGKCDIVTGGFPCQPYSVAGQRKGKEDDRHLWPHMLRAIQQVQPAWVVGENVPGLINWNGGMVFDEVQADLEAAGYEVIPFILPACGVNAPHKRERIWFVAYAVNGRRNAGRSEQEFNRNEGSAKIGRKMDSQIKGSGTEWFATNSESIQRYVKRQKILHGRSRWQSCRRIKRIGGKGFITNPNQQHGNLSGFRASEISQQQKAGIFCNHVTYAANIGSESTGNTRKRWAGFEDGNFTTGGNWQDFPAQSPVCFGNDGISAGLDRITFSKWRNESIKGAGNAVVWQVPFQIFKAIEGFNKSLRNEQPTTIAHH